MQGHLNTFIWKPRIVVIIEEDRHLSSAHYKATLGNTYLLGKKDCKMSTVEKTDITHSGLRMMSNAYAENMSLNQSLFRALFFLPGATFVS